MSSLNIAATLHTHMKQDVSLMSAETAVEKLLTSCIAFVRGVQESPCPINRLPPELLNHVFDYIPTRPQIPVTPTRDASTAFRIWGPTVLDTRSSVVLSQVCWYWRDVCLQSSTMWAHILDSQPFELDTLLERSRELPLKVLMTFSELRSLQFLSEQSHGIQELHWIQLDMQRSGACLSFPAPALRTLTLTGPRSSTSYHGADSYLDDSCPILFSNQTTALAHLSLCSLPWLPHNRFDNLTCLYIDSCHGPNLLIRLLSLLSGCPLLEHLVLSALSDLAPARADDVVALGALRTLVLKQVSADDGALLLRHLALPASTALRLADIFPCAASLPEALAVLPPVSGVTRLALDLTAGRPCVCAVGEESGVRVDEYTSWFHYEFWLGTAPVLVSRAQVRELWLRASGPVDRKHGAALHSLIKALPELELLVVNDDVVELLSSMQGTVPTCSGLTSIHVHCEGRIAARSIVDGLLANKTQLAGKSVVVCCMPAFRFVREEWKELDKCFRSVEYRFCESTPEMAMPTVCSVAGHMLWPSWREA
ncbi:uncharacterized protein B0H18DRAFT_1024549 [Fomitopsis serialis]|uniref:uncharacterized protein n=1 Tax=Fomitopsis serialis TaxID=139415 RepID=UPI0020083389|nr:uncharacterized protein B0H18DRAFT_1024549 [Neoantrodia serialis]KAH9920279.1 hypothetical protein B0H18DRAFT_1024549 [Neoantrodia serialis]